MQKGWGRNYGAFNWKLCATCLLLRTSNFLNKKKAKILKKGFILSGQKKSKSAIKRSRDIFSFYFQIAGIKIAVKADLPLTSKTFHTKLRVFASNVKSRDIVSLHHHFCIPDFFYSQNNKEIYRKSPWAIFRKGRSWIYCGTSPSSKKKFWIVAVFDDKHNHGHIFNPNENLFRKGNLHSLTMFPTDQIWLARVLAERQGFIVHAAGMKINGQGLLFAGHSEAGKSTTVTLLQNEGEILCDDRIIVRRWPEGFRIHGTWSHGDVPHVSSAEAPLRAILFLEKAKTNRLIPIEDPQEILKRILPLLIKPLVTVDWWEKTLIVIEKLVREVPAFRLQFDKSGKIKEIIRELVRDQKNKNRPRRKSRLP